MFAKQITSLNNNVMTMLFPNKAKNRYLFEENIYFNTSQICDLLNISKSCLSKQLKNVLKIPGCLSAYFRANYKGQKHYKYRRAKLMHYNLNTVVAIAFRINNDSCKKFLDSYHRIIAGLRIRLAGANYFIPSCLTSGEFLYYANKYRPPDPLNFED